MSTQPTITRERRREFRDRVRSWAQRMKVEPKQIQVRRMSQKWASCLYVVSRKADHVNGYRFEANLLDLSLPPTEAARCAGRHAGFEMHPQS